MIRSYVHSTKMAVLEKSGTSNEAGPGKLILGNI